MDQRVLNILLIDSESYRVESLRRGLKLMGHNVIATSTPRETIAELQRAQGFLDLIITDSTTPIAIDSGVTRAVRESHGGVPVLMMTSNMREDHRSHPLWPCCMGLIEKPFVPEQLAKVINGLGL